MKYNNQYRQQINNFGKQTNSHHIRKQSGTGSGSGSGSGGRSTKPHSSNSIGGGMKHHQDYDYPPGNAVTQSDQYQHMSYDPKKYNKTPQKQKWDKSSYNDWDQGNYYHHNSASYHDKHHQYDNQYHHEDHRNHQGPDRNLNFQSDYYCESEAVFQNQTTSDSQCFSGSNHRHSYPNNSNYSVNKNFKNQTNSYYSSQYQSKQSAHNNYDSQANWQSDSRHEYDYDMYQSHNSQGAYHKGGQQPYDAQPKNKRPNHPKQYSTYQQFDKFEGHDNRQAVKKHVQHGGIFKQKHNHYDYDHQQASQSHTQMDKQSNKVYESMTENKNDRHVSQAGVTYQSSTQSSQQQRIVSTVSTISDSKNTTAESVNNKSQGEPQQPFGAGQNRSTAKQLYTKKQPYSQQYEGQQNFQKKMTYLSGINNNDISQKSSYGGSSSQYSTNNNHNNKKHQITNAISYKCKQCEKVLREIERDFYPCNCKYKICYDCYDIQVREKQRKCPNCFLHYKVQRVEEYKQTRLNQSKPICKQDNEIIKDAPSENLSKNIQPANDEQDRAEQIKPNNSGTQTNQSSQQKDYPNPTNQKFYKKKATPVAVGENIIGDSRNNCEAQATQQDNLNHNSTPDEQQLPMKNTNAQNNCEQDFAKNDNIINEINQSVNELESKDQKRRSLSKESYSQGQLDTTSELQVKSLNFTKLNSSPQKAKSNFNNKYDPEEFQTTKQVNEKKPLAIEEISQVGQPLVAIEQIHPKIRTDEHIPIRAHEAEKLIETGSHQGPIQDIIQDSSTPTIHQKYDLVSKNNQDQEELESNLKNCKFQHQTGPEPVDSECMDMVSMRSSQTQNFMNNQLMYSQAHMKEEGNPHKRRTNSQENILTSTQAQFLQQFSSQSGYSIPGAAFVSSLQGCCGGKNSTNFPNKQRASFLSYSFGQMPNIGSLKGMKLNRIRIIQKTTIYIIGISPQIADEAIMRRYEFFSQYGEIQHISLNKDHAYNQVIQPIPNNMPLSVTQQQPSNTAGDVQQLQQQNAAQSGAAESKSTSSNRSQVSYAAYITYQSAEEASVAILALDQFVYDGRLIRASYGRTKYCKFFLKKTQCLNKDCPYQHYESKDSDIITPDDMQNKQLFQYCQQLALGISKITEVSESQFKIYLKDKRERLPQQNNVGNNGLKHILPKAESIFENKDLMKKIHIIKQQNLQQKQSKAALKQTLMASLQSTNQMPNVRIDNQRKISNQEQKSDRTMKSNQQVIQQNKPKIKKQQTQQQLHNQPAGELIAQQPNLSNKNQQSYVNKSKRQNGNEEQKVRQPRSGSHRQNERVQSKQKLQIVVGGGMRQSVTPRRHSYSRMLSQQRKEVQLGDMKKSFQNQLKNEVQLTDKIKMNKLKQFLQNQSKKYLQKGISNLQNNVKAKHEQVQDVITSEQSSGAPPQDLKEALQGQNTTTHNNQPLEDSTQRRTNRLVSKELNEQDVKDKQNDRAGNVEASRASRNRRYMMRGDRRKSVSKSIQRGQRDSSISSFIDHTLKFLNDDMAIPTKTMRDQEPLIEKIIENDSLENQSQINRMIQNQVNINDQLDVKSGFFSNGESRGYNANQTNALEINLQKINNIYTSPFFLINSQNHKLSDIESVYRIWEKFDSIENVLTLKNMYSNSDKKASMSHMDSQSFQDQGWNKPSLLMPTMRNSANPNNQVNESQSINLNNKNQGFNVQGHDYSQSVRNFYNPNQNLQQSQTNNMSLASKPYFKNANNCSASNSNYGNYQAQIKPFQLNQNQQQKGQSMMNTFYPNSQNQHSKSKQYLQISQQPMVQPFIANSAGATSTQQANLSAQKQSSSRNYNSKESNVVLNEKNLFIFDSQQDALFDKQQYWNQIFLPQQSHLRSGEKAVTDIENSKEKINPDHSNSVKLLTSQSVFSFPLGIDDDENVTPLKNQRSDLWQTKTRKSNENLGQKNDSLEFNQQKRKSMFLLSYQDNQFQNSARVNQKNNDGRNTSTLQSLTPQKQNTPSQFGETYKAFDGTKTPGGSGLKAGQASKGNLTSIYKTKKQSTISDPSSIKQPASNPFKISSNNLKCGIDGKSAGDELGTPGPTTSSGGGGGRFRDFYREFVKVNDLFGGVTNISSIKMRRNSCSKSQSHSRVRMQPSIYHDGNEEQFRIETQANPFRNLQANKETHSNEWNFKVHTEDDQRSQKLRLSNQNKSSGNHNKDNVTNTSQKTM